MSKLRRTVRESLLTLSIVENNYILSYVKQPPLIQSQFNFSFLNYTRTSFFSGYKPKNNSFLEACTTLLAKEN